MKICEYAWICTPIASIRWRWKGEKWKVSFCVHLTWEFADVGRWWWRFCAVVTALRIYMISCGKSSLNRAPHWSEVERDWIEILICINYVKCTRQHSGQQNEANHKLLISPEWADVTQMCIEVHAAAAFVSFESNDGRKLAFLRGAHKTQQMIHSTTEQALMDLIVIRRTPHGDLTALPLSLSTHSSLSFRCGHLISL